MAVDVAGIVAEHWLYSTNCDPVALTDRAQCACSLVRFPTRNSVGEAVRDWAEHVAQMLADAAKEVV